MEKHFVFPCNLKCDNYNNGCFDANEAGILATNMFYSMSSF